MVEKAAFAGGQGALVGVGAVLCGSWPFCRCAWLLCTHPALGGLQNYIDKRMACVVGWLDLDSCTQLASIQCGVVVRHGCYTQRPHTASAHETAWFNGSTDAGWHWVGRVGWLVVFARCSSAIQVYQHTPSQGCFYIQTHHLYCTPNGVTIAAHPSSLTASSPPNESSPPKFVTATHLLVSASHHSISLGSDTHHTVTQT